MKTDLTDTTASKINKALVKARRAIGTPAVGMVLTPPDVFSQTLLAVPMWMLFELGLLCAGMVKRRDEQDQEDSDSEPQDQPPAAQP